MYVDAVYKADPSKKNTSAEIMSVNTPDSTNQFQKVYLVDGQQRLTTLFLILWVLEDLYPSLKV